MNQKSPAYYMGYSAYEIWYINPQDPRPSNPYDEDSQLFWEWQQGWEDASIDL